MTNNVHPGCAGVSVSEREYFMRKNTKKSVLAVLALLLLVGAFLTVYTVFMPKTQEGLKEVRLDIVHSDGNTKSLTLITDLETLGEALKKEALVAGEEGPYGLFLTTVDGESVDESRQEWWCLTKAGETVMTGVDDTLIADGESYEITFTVGW